MAYPDPSQVAPWYLRNITQALELDEATGNVFVRTNAAIVGNDGLLDQRKSESGSVRFCREKG